MSTINLKYASVEELVSVLNRAETFLDNAENLTKSAKGNLGLIIKSKKNIDELLDSCISAVHTQDDLIKKYEECVVQAVTGMSEKDNECSKIVSAIVNRILGNSNSGTGTAMTLADLFHWTGLILMFGTIAEIPRIPGANGIIKEFIEKYGIKTYEYTDKNGVCHKFVSEEAYTDYLYKNGIYYSRNGEKITTYNSEQEYYDSLKTKSYSLDGKGYKVVSGFDESCIIDQHNDAFAKRSTDNHDVSCAAASVWILHAASGKPLEEGWEKQMMDNEAMSSIGAITSWEKAGTHFVSGSTSTTAAVRRELIYKNVMEGRPVQVWASSGHSVVAVGIAEGADINNLTDSDILIVDPADGKVRTLGSKYDLSDYDNKQGFSLHVLA